MKIRLCLSIWGAFLVLAVSTPVQAQGSLYPRLKVERQRADDAPSFCGPYFEIPKKEEAVSGVKFFILPLPEVSSELASLPIIITEWRQAIISIDESSPFPQVRPFAPEEPNMPYLEIILSSAELKRASCLALIKVLKK